jgi:protein-S-isoprenylcysteine O-methyltransferase Ste14
MFSAGLSRSLFYTAVEGAWIGVPLRILTLVSMGSVFVYIVNPQWLSWSGFWLPAYIRWLGFPLGILSIGLLLWIFRALGKYFSMSLHVGESKTFVAEGPYRLVRHPMYATLLIFWFSLFLLSANWFIGLAALLVQFVIMFLRTPKEERMMLDKFGKEYESYMKRTGRYLPFVER